MMTSEHKENSRRAKSLYVEENYLSANARENARDDWNTAQRMARSIVAQSLRESNYLRDFESALASSGSHMLAFRHMIAPPISQDQFKLLCPAWPKGTEKTGRPVSKNHHNAISEVLTKWIDPNLARWLHEEREPTRRELRSLLEKVSSHIAIKHIDTAKRNRISTRQEKAVVDLLTKLGWQKLPSKLIDDQGVVPIGHFMHKTRFSTGSGGHHEVDIACGLQGRFVLAMECKVSNDETNSVKRINDVLKKAAAWKKGWGQGIKTAAMLEGVIKSADVDRLTSEGVYVFWSHDLGAFANWLTHISKRA